MRAQNTALAVGLLAFGSFTACSSDDGPAAPMRGAGSTVSTGGFGAQSTGATGSLGSGGSGLGGASSGGALPSGGQVATGGTSGATGGMATGGVIQATGGSSTGGTTPVGGGTTGGADPGTGGAQGGGPTTGGGPGGGTGGGAGTPATGGQQGTGTWHALTSPTANERLDTEYQAWHTKFYSDCGDGSACIADGGRCVSEGIGYGMIAAVNMDDRDTFDKLWAYYLAHLDDNGLMHWQTDVCGGVTGQNAATDAELDAAMALLQAEARWGGYAAAATDLITRIRDFETEACGDLLVLRPGDAWGGCSDNNTVNPSYFAPAYYRVFANFLPDQADHWLQLASDTYDLFSVYQGQRDGLVCGWANISTGCTSDFDWDGVRAPWRIAADFAWFGLPEAEQSLLAMSDYVDTHGGISGLSFPANSAFRGSLALSGVATTQEKFDGYVDAWLAAATEDDPYFQATLRVLFLQFAAGKFPSTL